MSKIVRISNLTDKHLNELSKQTGKNKKYLIELAIKIFAREMFIKKANEEYKKLTEAEKKDIEIESIAWDPTLADGLKFE